MTIKEKLSKIARRYLMRYYIKHHIGLTFAWRDYTTGQETLVTNEVDRKRYVAEYFTEIKLRQLGLHPDSPYKRLDETWALTRLQMAKLGPSEQMKFANHPHNNRLSESNDRLKELAQMVIEGPK